jgi:Lon protease-like protein
MTILPIGCVGRIVKAEPLSCGRAFHLDLLGLARFRYKTDSSGEGSSRCQIELLKERPRTLLPEKKRYLIETLKNLKKNWVR